MNFAFRILLFLFILHNNVLFLFRSKSDTTISFVIQNELISIHCTRNLEENITQNVVMRTNERMSLFPSFSVSFTSAFFVVVTHFNIASCLTLNLIRPTNKQNEKLKFILLTGKVFANRLVTLPN